MPTDACIVVGLSGGPDSLFLLHLLAQLRTERNLTLVAAHLDHEWRPDSDKDAQFCAQAAQKLGIEFVTAKAHELNVNITRNGSLEEVGRKLRRHFLEHIMHTHGADRIALGHHAQDQQETFFIRLMRGTTLSGLCVMQPHAGPYVRPLLTTNKHDILAYLKKHHILYLEDPSNTSDNFLRNRIRTTVLPALRTCDDRFEHNFARTLVSLQQDEKLLQQEVMHALAQASTCQMENITLNLKELLTLETEMLNRVVLHWLYKEGVPFKPSQGFVAEIIKFLRQPHGGKHEIHTDWHLVKKSNVVSIRHNGDLS